MKPLVRHHGRVLEPDRPVPGAVRRRRRRSARRGYRAERILRMTDTESPRLGRTRGGHRPQARSAVLATRSRPSAKPNPTCAQAEIAYRRMVAAGQPARSASRTAHRAGACSASAVGSGWMWPPPAGRGFQGLPGRRGAAPADSPTPRSLGRGRTTPAVEPTPVLARIKVVRPPGRSTSTPGPARRDYTAAYGTLTAHPTSATARVGPPWAPCSLSGNPTNVKRVFTILSRFARFS